MAPNLVQQEVLGLLAKRGTAVMTNVPGPQYSLHLAQARITELLFCTPQSGDIGMGTSVLSYDGAIQFAVITDSHLVSDP